MATIKVRFLAKLFLSVSCTLPLSCTFQSTAIENGDFIAKVWVGNIIDLDDKQEDMMDQLIDEAWKDFRCGGAEQLVKDLINFEVKYDLFGMSKQTIDWMKEKFTRYRLLIFSKYSKQLF